MTGYTEVVARAGESAHVIVRFTLENSSRVAWSSRHGYHLGSQIYDPASGVFITEGEWSPIAADLAPGARREFEMLVSLPPQDGSYRVYVSPLHEREGWMFAGGAPFVAVDAVVERGRARILEARVTTVARQRTAGLLRAIPKLFTRPVETIARNRRLIRSMVKRDILARYRGSFGDVFWTVLNPLLLMSTYFFVFGVLLATRFRGDQSRTGFALYFLAGFLPWLAISEAVGRAPSVVLDYRNLVRKLVFPIETLPVNQVLAGLVTEIFALAIYLIALALLHGIPATAVWLPVLIVPQVLLTLGFCWFLAATGAYVRDLGQIIGFLLTLWFFITPICYDEAQLENAAGPLLKTNPLFVLVKSYRLVLLEGRPPAMSSLWKLWVVAIVVCIAGHAWFYKLRKSFADVI